MTWQGTHWYHVTSDIWNQYVRFSPVRVYGNNDSNYNPGPIGDVLSTKCNAYRSILGFGLWLRDNRLAKQRPVVRMLGKRNDLLEDLTIDQLSCLERRLLAVAYALSVLWDKPHEWQAVLCGAAVDSYDEIGNFKPHLHIQKSSNGPHFFVPYVPYETIVAELIEWCILGFIVYHVCLQKIYTLLRVNLIFTCLMTFKVQLFEGTTRGKPFSIATTAIWSSAADRLSSTFTSSITADMSPARRHLANMSNLEEKRVYKDIARHLASPHHWASMSTQTSAHVDGILAFAVSRKNIFHHHHHHR